MHSDKRRSKYGQVRTNEVEKSIYAYQCDMAVVTNQMTGFPEPIWDTFTVPLKDITTKCEVPVVAKIVKGQFHNLGVTKIPLKRLHQDVVVHSVKTGVKILAHSVAKFEGRDGRRTRIQSLDQRLSIPLSYQGWFELLSEDGRCMRPIDSVYRLARESPKKCLVRLNIKGYMPNDDGRLTFDKSKVVPAGEQLTLIRSISIPGERYQYLQCTDSKGLTVFLSFEQQGLFTPIAGPNDISGVFMIKDVLQRFRLPITVKLVQGIWPKVDASKFTGLIRLDWAYTDGTAFLCPIDKHSIRITPVPTEIPFKVTPAKNMVEIQESQVYQDVVLKCNRMVSVYNNTIHLIVAVPDSVMRKSKSHELANALAQQNVNNNNNTDTQTTIKRSKSKEDVLMDDADELYQYLREGRPPPRNKFQYDSDEESYFEEPAFEPINDFRARVAMIEKGESGHKKSKYYRPTSGIVVGVDENTPMTSFMRSRSSAALLQADRTGAISSPPQNPPPLPPRRYTRTDSSPMIRVQCNQPTADSSSGSSKGDMQRIASEPKFNRKSSYDSGSSPKIYTGATKDNKSSRTGSSGKRHSLHTLYL